MGSIIEINDTLKIKSNDGALGKKQVGDVIHFNVKGKRIYNLNPSRVYLVEEIDGKWNYVGHAVISELTINAEMEETSGRATLTVKYEDEYRRRVNQVEPPPGKNFLD